MITITKLAQRENQSASFINIFLKPKNNVNKKNIFAYKYYQKYFNNLKILNKLVLLLNKLKTNKQIALYIYMRLNIYLAKSRYFIHKIAQTD